MRPSMEGKVKDGSIRAFDGLAEYRTRCVERHGRRHLVIGHQPCIASDISRQYRSESLPYIILSHAVIPNQTPDKVLSPGTKRESRRGWAVEKRPTTLRGLRPPPSRAAPTDRAR